MAEKVTVEDQSDIPGEDSQESKTPQALETKARSGSRTSETKASNAALNPRDTTKMQELTNHLYNEIDKLETDLMKRSLKTQSADFSDVEIPGTGSKESTLVPRQRVDRHSTSSDTTTVEGGISSSASVTTLEGKSECESVSSDHDQSPDQMLKCDATAQNGGIQRPDTLPFTKPYERKRSKSEGQKLAAYVNENESGITEWKACRSARSASTAIEIQLPKDPDFENLEETMLSKSLPLGQLRKKGEMIEFVADDLQEMIRQSSPLTKTDSSGLSSRTSSVRSISSISSSTSSAVATSATSGMSRSPSSQFQQSPDDIPPIDPHALHDLEMQARKVADSVDLMMGNLKSNLHKMSAITVGCLDAYKTSVDVTCDSVDSSIKAMYALMAKCEELSNSMVPVYKLADQIKEIKRLLDRFEDQLVDKT